MRTLALITLLFASACYSSRAHHADLDDAGASADDFAGTTCVGIEVGAAPSILTGFSFDAPPAPTGGTIAEGTYFLTSETLYVAAELGIPFGIEEQGILKIDDNQFVQAFAGSVVVTLSGAYAVSGNQISFTPCVDFGLFSETFTVAGNVLTLYAASTQGSSDPVTSVDARVYAKQ